MDALLSLLFSSEEEERHVLDCMAYCLFFSAVCVFFVLLFEDVPYGRYASSRYGFPVNVKLAWFVQELPAFLVPLGLVVWSTAARTSLLPNQLLLAMYFCHYVHRTFIYPFLIRGGKSTPVISFFLAVVFCIYNGYMQVRYLSHYADYPADWVTHPCFITGSGLWLVGLVVNVHSDHILRNLRKPGETGYKIPIGEIIFTFSFNSCIKFLARQIARRARNFHSALLLLSGHINGGVFEYVSGANFLGEITEWAGFALAGHSVHSAAFALFTMVVLSCRAVAHHKWYLAKFDDYPKSRKALIPFVF